VDAGQSANNGDDDGQRVRLADEFLFVVWWLQLFPPPINVPNTHTHTHTHTQTYTCVWTWFPVGFWVWGGCLTEIYISIF